MESLVLAIYLPYFCLLTNGFFDKKKRLFFQTQVDVSREMVRRVEASPDLARTWSKGREGARQGRGEPAPLRRGEPGMKKARTNRALSLIIWSK